MSVEKEAKREKPKYFVVIAVDFCAENTTDLREFLENNDDESLRVIKGFEIFPKKKTVYSF
jgi:hypothetical protein